jgi:hypothetical protein
MQISHTIDTSSLHNQSLRASNFYGYELKGLKCEENRRLTRASHDKNCWYFFQALPERYKFEH